MNPKIALVLHDAPSLTRCGDLTRDFKLPLRVAYFGNLSEYGPLIENALRALKDSERVRLEVFGASPLWTRGAEDEFRSRGLLPRIHSVERIGEVASRFPSRVSRYELCSAASPANDNQLSHPN